MKQNKPLRLTIPDPLILALGLTILTLILSLIYGSNPRPGIAGVADVLSYWTQGFWDLLAFSMQMVLILMLGYMLALSPIVDRFSSGLARLSNKPVQGAVSVALVAVVVGLINWGLALVLGAVLVRKIAIQAKKNGSPINYPLMGAAAYVCMMVWHGGLSGSAPLSVASAGHFLEDKTGIIPLSATTFSSMNFVATSIILVLIPAATFWFAKKGEMEIPDNIEKEGFSMIEKQHSVWKPTFISISGFLLLAGFIIRMAIHPGSSIGLNEINLILFALVLIVFPNANDLSKATENSIGSTAGIIIQFPLYAGIMGIMQYSGLLAVMTEWFVSISTQQTLPLFSFLSAGIVNLFVPSGGGQWAVQGPLLIDVATSIGVSHSKVVMALAYGDQLTNMLQPFWALPLIGITGLKAGEIFRYSWRFLLIGFIVYAAVLWFF
ncbi:MAG: TIGR00366 family protein [Bacteroidales bacterium]|nr:TIGR00366 family protein [Bacteroidales bacterium]